jgi:phosphoribosyl 1,2-cyclic phosphodiesterase
LLLEAGLPIKEILRKLDFRLSQILACIVTHEHGDHAKGVAGLLGSGIDCYMSAGTAKTLGILGHHRLHIIRDREPFDLWGWRVMPLAAVHDAGEPLSFLLQRGGEMLLFAVDTAYIRFRMPTGLTHVMIGCDYDLGLLKANVKAGLVDPEVKRRVLRSHMSLQTLKGFLKANDLSRVKEIHLLHLSQENSDAERFKREIAALSGKVVYVP